MVTNLIEFPANQTPDNARERAYAREGGEEPPVSHPEDAPDGLVDAPDDPQVPEAERGPVLDKTDDRLADLYDRPYPKGIRDRVRYDHSRKRWHIWNEKANVWKPDDTGEIYHLMADRLGTWINAAMSEGSEGKIKALSVLLNQQKKESVLKALSWHRGIAMRGDEWDPDPSLLGCENGIVDLRTAQLIRGKHPELLVTRSTHLPYVPDAWQTDCPRFMTFMEEITSGNAEVASYLLRVLGYALYGHQREQKFWVFIGQGQNGKGVLIKTVSHVLGDYAISASSALYMRSKHGDPGSSGPRADLMALQGKRFLATSEPVAGAFNDELVKQHTGGDMVRARTPHAPTEIQFPPTWTIFFLTNNPPRLEDVGPSMQRRLRAVHFNEDFRGAREDKGLEDLFKGPEAVGILSCLIQQAQFYHELGMPEPEVVLDASRAYIEENDPLSEFIHDCCVIEPRATVQSKLLFAAYLSWTVKMGYETMTTTKFGLAMSRRFHKDRNASFAYFTGIRTKSVLESSEDGSDES